MQARRTWPQGGAASTLARGRFRSVNDSGAAFQQPWIVYLGLLKAEAPAQLVDPPPYPRPASGRSCSASSLQHPHERRHSLTDLVGAVLLDEMQAFDGRCGLVRPLAT